MRRSIASVVLSALLLFMQQEAALHALSHLGPQVLRSHETALVAPHAYVPCVECALLASGTAAAVGDDLPLGSIAPAPGPAWIAYRSRASDFPASFSSRAPPVLV